MEVEDYSPAAVIIQQGDTDADKFYVIKSGR
jgi:CRP-like cAMP-binding protein